MSAFNKPLTVGTANIADGAVTSQKIADNTIVDADISTSAAISIAKLTSIIASKALVVDPSGNVTTSPTSRDQIGFLQNISEDLQTTLDNKVAKTGGIITGPIAPNSVEVLDGVVVSPAFTFQNDNNTGLYSVAVDAIGVAANGAAIARLDSSGFKLVTVGEGFHVKEGTNATMGTLVLNGTTEVTVNTTKVTANSRIFLSVQVPGGTPSGTMYISSRIAGTSFGVKSVSLDTSTVAWLIVEPA